MGRFERDDIEATHLPKTLGIATEGLRSTIELEVAKIVEGAETRAAEIEDQALEKASRIEQDSERRLEAAFQDSRQRLAQMLSEIDGVELSLGQAVRSLRAEAQALTGDLGRASTEPYVVEDPVPAPEEPRAAAPAAEIPVEPEAETSRAPGDPQVRELIRHELTSLAEGGRTRADAERMLLRFRQGEQYFDLLDEIYPEAIPGRRGLLRRRKERD